MIEFPPPPPPVPAGSRRGLAMAAGAVALVLVVVVALINSHRAAKTVDPLSDRIQPLPSASPSPSGPTREGDPLQRLPLVSCPQIRDEQSRLSYRCVDDKLQQAFPDTNLGLRISLNLEVEPNWVVSEGSGNPQSLVSPPSNDAVGFRQAPQPAGAPLPSAAQVRDEVRRRVESAVARAYGDNPTSTELAGRVRSFGGVPGYEQVSEITINPAYRASNKLTVRTERLWTVGLPTTAGVSIFMLSIPDGRADLWPKAEATVATVRVL